MRVLSLFTQVPICLAGTDTDEFLTAEPAVVLHEEVVDNFAIGDQSAASLDPSESPTSSQMVPELTPRGDRRKTQHGATLRRAVHKLSIMRKSTPSTDSELYDHLNAEERAGVSPFERSMSSRDITKNVPGGESPSQRSMSDRHVTKNLPQSWIPNLGTAGKSMRSLDKATGAHERSSWISRSSAIAPEIGDLTESKGDSTSAFT